MIAERKPLNLGRVVATPGALDALEKASQSPLTFLQRHARHDWGDVCDEDRDANERALDDDTRIMSVYHTAKGDKIWVITEADRSSTCILLPEEY